MELGPYLNRNKFRVLKVLGRNDMKPSRVREAGSGSSMGITVTTSTVMNVDEDDEVVDSPRAGSTLEMGCSRRELYLRDNVGNPLVEVLQVDLVAKPLLSYLNLADLKSLSEASWGTMNAVRKSKQFSELARLHLSLPVLKNGFVKLNGGKHFFWKHISVDLLHGTGISDGLTMYSLKKHLEEAETLNIYLGPFWGCKDPSLIFHRLGEVLRKTVGLKVLGLEVGILNYPGGYLFYVYADIRRFFDKLEGLVIHGHRHSKGELYHCISVRIDEEGRNAPIRQNLLEFSMAMTKLKKLSFSQRLPNCFVAQVELEQVIAPVVIANKNSLEVLELHHHHLRHIENVTFPKLRSLMFSADGRHMNRVENFLFRQPSLEELEIYLKVKCNFWIPHPLLLSGKLGKLKRLHLGANRAARPDEANLPMDWQFLKTIIPLKDFSLTLPFTLVEDSWYGIGEEILASLPRTMEKISLKDIGWFWEIQEGNIGSSLAGFRNLRELDLFGSRGAVTDSGLQSLIIHCPKLTLLSFSKCDGVTDYGITGVRVYNGKKEKVGMSLDQLKGLKHLKIRDCPRITRKGLIRVMNFQDLRTFDFHGPERDLGIGKKLRLGLICRIPDYPFRDREFLFWIVRQNPSLEKVSLRPFWMDREYSHSILKFVLDGINPRVKVLDLVA